MIIVMTLNVGYFFAVLAGIFVGELIFGRLISSSHSRTAKESESTNLQQ